MTVIGNNNTNNSNTTLSIAIPGTKNPSGLSAATSFMDIISMLSTDPKIELAQAEQPGGLTIDPQTGLSSSNLAFLKDLLNSDSFSSEISLQDSNIKPNETASNFLKMLQDKITRDVKPVKINTEMSNIAGSPVEKILVKLALDDIADLSRTHATFSEVATNNLSKLDASVSEYSKPLSVRELQITSYMINRTVMEDTSPKSINLDFDNIIRNAPSDFDGFHVTKIFTNLTKEVGTPERVEPTLSNLNISLRPGFVEASFESENIPLVVNNINFDDITLNEKNKLAVVEIEKPVQGTTIINIDARSFRNTDDFPKQIIVNFLEPSLKSIAKNNFQISKSTVNDFPMSETLLDSEHVAVLTKPHAEKIEMRANILPEVQIFRTSRDNGIEAENSLKFLQKGEISQSLSEEIIAKLEPIVSGELSIRKASKKLENQLAKLDSEAIIDKNLKLPVAEILRSIKRKTKPALMISTAEVVGYKQAMSGPDKYSFDFQWIKAIGDKLSNNDLGGLDSRDIRDKLDNTFNRIEAKSVSNNLSDFSRPASNNQNIQTTSQQNVLLPSVNPTQNGLSLYDAQFSSRLAMLITDQLINGVENFEIQLEPETFGKMRVNISLENSNVEVKMLAENSAAVSALRGSESILQNIAEQNGLRLSDYSVDMQNNQNGDNSSRKNAGTGENNANSEHGNDAKEDVSTQSLDNNYNLNLLA